MEKLILSAVKDVLKERVDKFNNGLFASHHASNQSIKVMMENGIHISGDTVLQRGVVIAKIRNRYDSHRRMRQPIIEEVR